LARVRPWAWLGEPAFPFFAVFLIFSMPSLDWIGKSAVLNHHAEVPYRLLHCNGSLSAGDKDSGNLLVQGDNLEALKALLPHYAGQVKCIYIDPPYNTGNESWVYNDNVNSPEMRRWLGKVVGKESEDLSRHDKWLCMMYPRLRLLREFLREDGVIFISIDDNEQAHLKLLMDEVFGEQNFITTVIWQKVYAPKSSAKHFSEDHDYILVYAKSADSWIPDLLPRTDGQNAIFKNLDNDPRGLWRANNLAARNFYSRGTYSIKCPGGRLIEGPPKGSYWRYSEEKLREMDADNRIWWGEDGNNVPAPKIFLSEVKDGRVPQTLWPYKEVGHTQEAKKELLELVSFESSDDVFITPKPTRLIQRVLQIASDKDSIILDSFAGSGTTGHAVLAANAADGGTRRFILVEMDKEIAKGVTAQRLRRVVEGYDKGGDPAKPVAGLGGGFRFCRLGTALFDELGEIVGEVSFADLAAHVFFIETGSPLPKRVPEGGGPFIGAFGEKAVYLLYSPAAQGVPVEAECNVLTPQTLRGLTLPESGDHAAQAVRVVYAEGCALSAEQLETERIVFRQIPYHLTQAGGATH